jgi:hypothetical protein
MTNYVKTTNFLRKDSLPDTDNDKIIRGSEFDVEFNNLVTAVASKANLESPNFTGVPRAPTASVGSSTTQIATTAFVAKNAILRGMIVMWSGTTATIPTGYALCNGANGTPDLRNRMIMGAGSSYAPGATGGSANSSVPSHSHGASTSVNTLSQTGYFDTINRGGTSYRNPMVRRGAGTVSVQNFNNGMSFGEGWEGEGGSGGTRTTINTSHNHTASTTVSAAGGSATNANLPPYYALAFIMKT